MLSILDRLLIRETLKTLLVILSVLLALILANALVKLLGQVAEGLISFRLLGLFIGLEALKLLGFILPPAFFFSILWVLGQMYRNSEMVALNVAGAGLARLYRPLTLLALLLALIVGGLVLHVLPAARGHADLVRAQEKAQFRLEGLRPGAFNEFRRGQFMIYVGKVGAEKGLLQDVFVRYVRQGKSGVLVAKNARLEQLSGASGRFLILENGHRYQGVPGEEGFSSGRFQRYGIRLPETEVVTGRRSRSALPSAALLASDEPKYQAEFQWRLSAPLSVFALMLISVPLARSLPRQGVYGRLILAILFYAVYLNLIKLAEEWMKQGITPEWLGVWWVPASAALCALLLIVTDSIAVATRWRRFLLRWS